MRTLLFLQPLFSYGLKALSVKLMFYFSDIIPTISFV